MRPRIGSFGSIGRTAALACVLAAAWLPAPALATGATSLGAGLGAPPRLAGPGVPCPDPGNLVPRARVSRSRPDGLASPPADTTGFVIFGWVTPPADTLNEARVAEMAAIGLNLMLPTWLDEGCREDNLARLDWAEAHGLRCLIWDSRLMGAVHWLPTFEDTLDQVAADYRDHPAFWGYYLGDEPPASEWPMLARLRASLRARDPAHPGWDALRGRVLYPDLDSYLLDLRGYSDAFLPAVICAAHYDLRTFGDYGWFVEHLVALRTVADERRLPFWNIVQLVPHANIRPLRPGELRWQVSQSLAYGARGIGYFTYWTPDPDPSANWQPAVIDNDGTRTGWYDFLLGFNPGVRAAGDALARASRYRTTHARSVPQGGVAFTSNHRIHAVGGRAAIGEFAGAAGELLVLVVNSDSIASASVTIETRVAPGARLVASGSSPHALSITRLRVGARLTLALAAGDFALLELEAEPRRAVVRASPNPALGAVRFAIEAPLSASRLTISDLAGRVVWSTPIATAFEAIEWRGQRDDGRTAGPGVYFARLSMRPGDSAVRRFVWLGAR